MIYIYRRKFRIYKGLGIRGIGSEVRICSGAERQGPIWVHAPIQSDHANWYRNVRCHQGNGRGTKDLSGVNHLRYHDDKFHGSIMRYKLC